MHSWYEGSNCQDIIHQSTKYTSHWNKNEKQNSLITVLVGIEVNLIDNLDTDKIEIITDKIEDEIMKIIPESKTEYIFVEMER